jgi:hypothetical protein
MQRHIVLALATLVLAAVPTQLAAGPPRPGTEGNGLNESEAATLWSRDDDQYVTTAAYEAAYDENRTAVHTVANATDLTFARPPATAAVWTRNDHREYTAGNATTSVYPAAAEPVNGTYIADAHATIFAMQPATWVHRGPDDVRLYLKPNGTLRGTVDYRVRVPAANASGDQPVSWELLDHEIEAVRVLADGAVVARASGSHRPVLDYRLPADTEQVTLAADVRVELAKTTPIRQPANATATRSPRPPNGTDGPNRTMTTRTDTVTETLTVTDTRPVQVYDLQAWLSYVRGPDGDTNLAAFQSAPWQGFTVGPNDRRVRGVWRFYTARDTGWDTVTVATATGERTRAGDALPVAVHAYPSELAPRVADPGGPLRLTRVWGPTIDSPAGTLGANVAVEVVERPYRASSGIAVRFRERRLDPETVTVHGVVRNTTAELRAPAGGRARELRDSKLTMTVVERSADHATLRVRLTDAETGAPIVLQDRSTRLSPLATGDRRGYIQVGNEIVRTGPDGTATVTVSDPGVYTARYTPDSWLQVDPAYTTATGTARWHPLHTVEGWIALLTTVLRWALPFVVVWYAGRQLGRLWGREEVRR